MLNPENNPIISCTFPGGRIRPQEPTSDGAMQAMRVDGQETNLARPQETNLARPSMFQTGKGRSVTVSEESLRRVDSLFTSEDQSERRESRGSANEG